MVVITCRMHIKVLHLVSSLTHILPKYVNSTKSFHVIYEFLFYMFTYIMNLDFKAIDLLNIALKFQILPFFEILLTNKIIISSGSSLIYLLCYSFVHLSFIHGRSPLSSRCMKKSASKVVPALPRTRKKKMKDWGKKLFMHLFIQTS